MHEHSYLLFGEERWAIAHHSIARVEGVDGVNTLEAMDLCEWDTDSRPADARGHVLRLETGSLQVSLIVYGQLKSLQVADDQVIELPGKFFASSPAYALILREEHHAPALLIDPAKLSGPARLHHSAELDSVGEKT